MSKLQCQAKVIQKLQSDFCSVLQHNIDIVLEKSWSAGLIGPQVHQLSSSDPERTSKFMSAVHAQVGNDPLAFDKFTRILQGISSLEHLADRLEKEFNAEYTSIRSPKTNRQQASSQLTGYCDPCKETADHLRTTATQGKSVASDHESLDIIDKPTAANHDDDVQIRRGHIGHRDIDVKDSFSTHALQSFSSDVNSDAVCGNSSAKILEPVQESLHHATASRHVFVGNVASEPDGFERIRHWTSVEALRSREMETRAVELKQKVEKVTQENEKLKQQLEEAQKKLKKLERQKQRDEVEFNHIKEQYKTFHVESEKTIKDLQKKLDLRSYEAKQRQEMKEENNSLKEQLDQTKQKIEELEEQKQFDDEEICRIKGEFESYQRESEKTKKELEEKLDLKSNEAKVLEQQLKECKSKKMEAENKLTEQAKEVERLRKEYEALESDKKHEIEEVRKLFNAKFEELEKAVEKVEVVKREDELQHRLKVSELSKKFCEFEKTSKDDMHELSLAIKDREIEVEKMRTQVVRKDEKLKQMKTQREHQETISQLKKDHRQESQELITRIQELEEKQKTLEKGHTQSPDTNQVGSIKSVLFTIDEHSDHELSTSFSDLSLD